MDVSSPISFTTGTCFPFQVVMHKLQKKLSFTLKSCFSTLIIYCEFRPGNQYPKGKNDTICSKFVYILPACKYITDKFCVILSFPKPKYYIFEANEHGMKNRTHTQSHTCCPILKNEITYLFYSSDVFWIIFLYYIMCPSKPPKPQLRYKFKFKKRGLQGNEFKDCLTSKVDELSQGIKRIKTLKGNAITDVRREVCIRENLSNSYLDQRSPRAIANFRRKRQDTKSTSHSKLSFSESERDPERILRATKDTPMRHKKAVSVPPGEQRLDKLWNQIYHEEQDNLFAKHLLKKEELRDLLPDIEVHKGYISRRDGKKLYQLNRIEFFNVIDKISVFFLGKLEKLRPNNRQTFRNQWGMTLESVYESCKVILVYRNAVDWCTDNDLMSGNYDIWKDHVMAMISFSALMAVTKMLCLKLE